MYTDKTCIFGGFGRGLLISDCLHNCKFDANTDLADFFISKANELSKLNFFVFLLYTIDYTSSAWDVGKECR